jgi:hypothetical protein
MRLTMASEQDQLELHNDITPCDICYQLRKYLEDRELSGIIDCGLFEDAIKTDCPNHGPLLRAFYTYSQTANPSGNPSKDVGFTARGPDRTISLFQSVTRLGAVWNLMLVNHVDDKPEHLGIGRVLDQDWVDLDVIRVWKDECLSKHDSMCRNPLRTWHARPA